MSDSKIAPVYSVWISNNTGALYTILGFTALPELQTEGIILGSDSKPILTISTETFSKNFKRKK